MTSNTDQGILPYTYLRKNFEDFEKLTAESMRKNRRLREESQQNKRGISTKQKLKDNLLLISFNSNSIYLNGIKLISDKSKLQQAIQKSF